VGVTRVGRRPYAEREMATETNRTMLSVHVAGQCSVAATAEIVGSKWTVIIVHDLSEGPRRSSCGTATPNRHRASSTS
jgi:DNA-binding HxlR family transcriptional regulator